MHRIDTPTAMIDKFGQGKNGFTNGDTTTGRRATQLTDNYWDAIQEEICIAIESADIVLDKAKNNQLSLAIKAIINSNALLRENNLSDVVNKTKARANLGIVDSVYPVGIVTWFAQNKNPNTLFPGTTWVYIGENKTIRLAKPDGSDVMTTGGADTVALNNNHLPAHNHTFYAETSYFDYGWKSGGTANGGNHFHSMIGDATDADNGSPIGLNKRDGRLGITGSTHGARGYMNTLGDGTQIIAWSGEHAHSFSVAIGGHSHTVSGTTSSSGSGAGFSVVNSFVKLMGWYRSA